MTESKIVATDRLRKKDVGKRRPCGETKNANNFAEDMTKAEANEVSWEAMTEQHSPLQTIVDEPPKGSLSDAVELVDFDPDDYDGSTDLSGDIAWT